MKAVLLAAALGLTACSTVGANTTGLPGAPGGPTRGTTDLIGGAPSARLVVSLFDAPLDSLPNAKVNIGLLGVQLVNSAGRAVPFVTNDKPHVVNLLDLQNHSEDFNGDAPSGTYSAIRLLIDPASSDVTADGGVKMPILWGAPGHTTSASVIAIDAPCTFVVATSSGGDGAPTSVSMDFNLLQSVLLAGGVAYIEPNVRASNAAARVNGKVKNAAGKAVSSATVIATDANGNVVNTTATAKNGAYHLNALPAGVYTLSVQNTYVTAAGATVQAVGADPGSAPSTSVILSPKDKVHVPDLID